MDDASISCVSTFSAKEFCKVLVRSARAQWCRQDQHRRVIHTADWCPPLACWKLPRRGDSSDKIDFKTPFVRKNWKQRWLPAFRTRNQNTQEVKIGTPFCVCAILPCPKKERSLLFFFINLWCFVRMGRIWCDMWGRERENLFVMFEWDVSDRAGWKRRVSWFEKRLESVQVGRSLLALHGCLPPSEGHGHVVYRWKLWISA